MNLFEVSENNEIIHTRLSVYIRYSSLILGRKKSHSLTQNILLHKVFNLKGEKKHIPLKECLAPNVQNTLHGLPLL